jgi:GT2 family glycosyltransferase
MRAVIALRGIPRLAAMRSWAQLLAPIRRARAEIAREIARVPDGEPKLTVLGERALRFLRLRAEDVRGLPFHLARAAAVRAEIASLLPWPERDFERVLSEGFLGEPPAEPRVSVIIPVYGKLELTVRCLLSVRACREKTPFEIVVVDDCSPDRTEAVLSRVPGLRYLRNEVNGGFITSCNRGAREARGHHLCFLNNDTVVLPGWLDRLVETLETVEGAGLVGSRLIYPTFRLQESGGIVWRDASATNWGNGCDPWNPTYGSLRDVDYASAASVLIERSLFESIGGFDLRYQPAYYEDTDLAFAVRARGRRTLVQPASRVVHHEGGTAGTDVAVGMKKHQVINQASFRTKWADVLATHGPSGELGPRERDRWSERTVLVVATATPRPDSDSGSVDLANLLCLLRTLRSRVIFFAAHPVPRGVPAPDVKGHDGAYTEALQRIGIEHPHAPYEPSLARWLREHGRELDLVVLTRARIADRFLPLVRAHAPQAKVVFNTVDLHYLREEREAAHARSALLSLKAKDTRARELRAVRESDATIVLSEVEREVLAREVPAARVRVLPLLRTIPGRSAPIEGRRGVIFVGGFKHRPNVDAVEHLVSEIWPHVRASGAALTLHVVGSAMPDSLRALAAGDVVMHGHVPDLAPLFASVRLSVAPLRFGAGLKGKIADSLGHGVPCVTTSIGVEGSGLLHETHVLVADEPARFAAEIVRLHADDALWTRLSDAGLAFVRETYDLASHRRRLEALLEELAPASGRSPRT